MKRPFPAFEEAFFFILSLILAPSLACASIGAVAGASGSAYLKTKISAKWTVAAKGAPVGVGDRVKTGGDGRIMLLLDDGSRLSIGNDSELELTEFISNNARRKAVYSLPAGKLRAVVSRFSGRSDIKVRTPTGVAGVKGTDFLVMSQGPANVIFGNEGSVEVGGGGKKTVTLGAGMMTENTGAGHPIEPVAVEPGSALQEAQAGLAAVTDTDAPVDWQKAGKLPQILARWNINYSHYLADGKRFAEALEVLKIAVDLGGSFAIKAEAHLERATLLSRNLNEPRRALAEYMAVIERYPEPPFLENAVFSAGMINMELGRKKEALVFFKKYMEQYPEGGHRETAEFFINILETD